MQNLWATLTFFFLKKRLLFLLTVVFGMDVNVRSFLLQTKNIGVIKSQETLSEIKKLHLS